MEGLGNGQVIRRSQGLAAKLVKVEPRHAAGGFRHLNHPTEQGKLHGRALRLAGKLRESSIQSGFGPAIGGDMPSGQASDPLAPVIPCRDQGPDLHMPVDERDEGQEGVPPRLALEQIIRGGV